MHSLNNTALESNKYMKINFDRGNLSSDADLLLVKEFAYKLGFDKILRSKFKTNDPVLTAVLGKATLASQPTLSRFFNRMDDATHGHQEGEGFNFHYQNHGYHPLKSELFPQKAGF